MKKILCVLLAIVTTLWPVASFAIGLTDIRAGSEFAEVLKVLYEAEFSINLDKSFYGTWLYDISDNGRINVTFKKTNHKTEVGKYYGNIVTLTVNGHTMIERSNNWGGPYDFEYGVYEENNVRYKGELPDKYNSNDGQPIFLRMAMELNNGRQEIILWLRDTAYNTLSNKMNISMSYVTEKFPEDMSTPDGIDSIIKSIYTNKGESFERIAGSEEYYEEKERIESYNDPNTPIDYSPDSLDPRRWDDKEKAIDAFGQYKNEDGEIVTVYTLEGTRQNGTVNVDYTVDIKAEFEADLRKSDLSSDGKVKATYYVLTVSNTLNDFTNERQLLHLQGDKGEMWLASGNIDVRRPNPNVEIDESNMLTDDSSIYVQFKEIDFDGSRYEYVDEERATGGGLTFRYNDESKIVLEGLELKYDGRQASLVPLEEIDYTGGLATFFLNAVYPETYKEIAKEMGIEL